MNTHEHTRIGSLLRGIALVAVVLTGLLSILATVPSGGQPPRGAVACAGRDQQVKTGTVVRLDARCSSLTEWAAADDYLRLSWLFMRRPAGSAAALSDATAIDPSFTADAEGIYVLELFARSTSTSSIDRGEVTITATADSTNATPVAHAGSSRHVKVGDSPALDGSRSADADGERLSYEWTLTEPLRAGITITDADTATPAFDTPVSTIYRFQLQVNDGNVDSAPDRVDVRVSNNALNACPDADAGPDQRVPVGTLVTLDGSATDAENDPMTLRWRMLWRPDGSNAVLDDPLDNPAPTFTADVAGSYAMRLAADDSGTLDSRANCADRLLDVRDTVLVTASAGNSGPVANAGPDRSVDLQATVQLNGGGSSDADGEVLEYVWSFVSLPAASSAALSDAMVPDPRFVADVAAATCSDWS